MEGCGRVLPDRYVFEMSPAHNYAALVKLFKIGRVFPDALGWATLSEEQAEEIRSLGFSADAGRWKSPVLPPELTRYTIFESLSIGCLE